MKRVSYQNSAAAFPPLFKGRGREGFHRESEALSRWTEPTPNPSLEKGGEQVARKSAGKAKKKYKSGIKAERARRLRNDATPAERLLWTKINRKQIGGYKFRRQHPIGLYVLDFYCVELKLCIELDGGQHAYEENRRKDEQRTTYLENKGIAVLRFWNIDVLGDVEGAIQMIFEEARSRAYELNRANES